MLIVKILNFNRFDSFAPCASGKDTKNLVPYFYQGIKGPIKSWCMVGHILTHCQMALELISELANAARGPCSKQLCPVISHIYNWQTPAESYAV